MARTAAAIQTELDTWYDARAKVASGQSYTINGRVLQRANLQQINDTIRNLEHELRRAQYGSRGMFTRGRVSGFGHGVR